MLPINPGGTMPPIRILSYPNFLNLYPDPLLLPKSNLGYSCSSVYLDLSQTVSIMQECYSGLARN